MAEDPRRFEAARQAVRALAGAFRTLRLYPLGHDLTLAALREAEQALNAYTDAYGALVFTVASRGVAFDFSRRSYADDVVLDLTRAMRSRAVPGLRILPSLHRGDAGEFLSVLHRPVDELERAGGVAREVSRRGVSHLLVEHVAERLISGVSPLEPLLAAARVGAQDRIAAYLEQIGGDPTAVRESMREFDRRIGAWPRDTQYSAWSAIGQTLASLRAPWQAAVCAMVVQSVEEPWAEALASQWPPVLAASLATQAAAGGQDLGRRVAEVLRTFHRPIARGPLPSAAPLTQEEIGLARRDIEAWPEKRIRERGSQLAAELTRTVSADRTPSKEARRASPAEEKGGMARSSTREDRVALTRFFVTALQNVRHYGPQHPVATEAIRQLDNAMRKEFRAWQTVVWQTAGDWLMVQSEVLPEVDQNAQEFRRHLEARGIRRFALFPSLRADRLGELIRTLSREPEELIAMGGFAKAVQSAGFKGVEVDQPRTDDSLPPETDEYREACAAMADMFTAVERGDASIDAGRVRATVDALTDHVDSLPLWRQVLSRGHDELDPPHAVNVAFLAIHLARSLGVGEEAQVNLGIAGLLHDIGMAHLRFEERLTERLRAAPLADPRHCGEGGRLLERFGWAGMPMLVALEHHRVISGAPDTAPHAQLVALVDYLDAMTCGRAPGARPSTIGETMRALLAGKMPGMNQIHVRSLATLFTGVISQGVDLQPSA